MALVQIYYPPTKTYNTVPDMDVSYWKSQGWTDPPKNQIPAGQIPARQIPANVDLYQRQGGEINLITVPADQADYLLSIGGYSRVTDNGVNATSIRGVPIIRKREQIKNPPISNDSGNVVNIGGVNVDTNGWSQSMIDLIQGLNSYVQKLDESGKVVNPNIDLTPERLAEFINTAKSDVSPYFKQLFTEAERDIGFSLGDIANNYAKKEAEIGRQFGTALENTQESYAKRGLNYSSDRYKAEQTLSDEAKRMMQDERDTALKGARDIGLKGERALGSNFLEKTSLPTLKYGAEPVTGKAGYYGTAGGGRDLNLYNVFGGITGEMATKQSEAEKQRANSLEQQYRDLYKTYI